MNGLTPHELDLRSDDHGATASILQQLTDAVAAMKNTPGIRFSPWHRIDFQHSASSVEEVDAIAAGIGATPKWNEQGTHYEATRMYGPNVSYLVVFITKQHMDDYTAHWATFGANGTRKPVAA